MTIISIKDRTRNQMLAQAELDHGTFKFEGNYYFDPACVDMSHLVVSKRIYTCPYKGQALWIDLQADERVVKDVAWVYQDPKPGYGQIKNHIGFYDGIRAGTVAERTEAATAPTTHRGQT